MQDRIENICTENPTQFWNYVKKLGPQFNSKIPEEVYDEHGNIKTDLDEVLKKWKSDYENLYKTTDNNFDDNFYNEILELLRNAENRMNDHLYVPNASLNKNFSANEIEKVIDRLKNRKAPGIDNIPNEVLKCAAIKNCLAKLFQYYFDTEYLESNNLLEDVQNGFRSDRNCIDHVFILYSVIKNRKNSSLDTFVAFIDFFKCFDIINRDLLFFKLTEYGVDGKMYNTLKMMYTNTYSCVNINNGELVVI